jgi:tetratricopeptide (TPR) repeat protein
MRDLRRLVGELHRRSLWQVLLIYATGSWVVYQIALDLADGLGLPDWVAPTALVLLLAGLPVVLATAFIQEGPPTGPERERDAPGDARAGVPGTEVAAADSGPAGEAAARLDRDPTATEPSTGATRVFTWRNALLGGVAAFALLGLTVALFMASRLLGVGPAATLFAQGALDEDARILLADVEGPPADSAIAEMVTEALRVDLEQSPVVRLAEPRLLREALGRMQRDSTEHLGPDIALEVAAREGIPAVLAAELHRAGGALVIAARLLSPDGGGALASFRQTAADSTQVVGAVDRLSGDIRARIGESLSSIRSSTPLERVTTRSLPALQRYTTAVRLLRAEPESREAAALLEQAVADDSTFAMAWFQLGRLYSFYDDEVAGPGRELRAIARAREHAERLAPRERLLVEAWHQHRVRADQEARYTAIQRLLAEHPDDLEGLNELVEYLRYRKDYAGAQRALDRLLALDSTWALAADDEWALAAFQGRTEEARRALDRYAARFPADSLYVLNQRAFLAAADGDYERADSLWRRLGSIGPDNIYSTGTYWSRSLLERAQGRLDRFFDLRAEAVRRFGAPEAAVGFDTLYARLSTRAWLGLPADAELAAIRRGVAGGILDSLPRTFWPEASLAAALAIAGHPAEGERILDAWLASASDSVVRAASWRIPNARGEIALAADRPDDALAAFREVHEVGECPTCGLVDIGRSHLAAGRPDSAIAAFEAYLSTPDPFRINGDAQLRAFALEGLARLYEEAGETVRASAVWAEFAELWRDADPELQPRVEAARRRVQALVDRGG